MTLTQRLLSLLRLRPAPTPGSVWHLAETRWSAGLSDEDMQRSERYVRPALTARGSASTTWESRVGRCTSYSTDT